MGLATARIMGRDHTVVLTDVGAERLAAAADQLAADGIEVVAVETDITDRAAVAALVQRARQAGGLRAVVHAAGVSPQMGDPEFIVRVNALGTVYLNEAVLPYATEGFAMVNVASVAGHMLPGALVPTRMFPLATTRPEVFVQKLVRRAGLFRSQRSGVAYSFSKAFVIWYSMWIAAQFGAAGARVVSVSPGTFDTEMGRLEEKSGSAGLLEAAAHKRYGRAEEVAELLAFLASEQAGYLTGTDVLIDGGTRAGMLTHGAKIPR